MSAHRFRTAVGMTLLMLLAAVPGTCLTITVPDTFSLNNQGKLYKPFPFNHTAHVKVVGGCADCHHHTTGTPVDNPNCVRCHKNSIRTNVVACRGCHAPDPFVAAAIRGIDTRIYHADKPGVRGAMHRNCIGCHSKRGGPVGCQDCHALTTEGYAFYNAGKFAPRGKPAKGGH